MFLHFLVSEKDTLAQEFSTGYFLGEILKKHQLQNDFDAFSTGQTADAKLNNFTRIEPTLHLLQVIHKYNFKVYAN